MHPLWCNPPLTLHSCLAGFDFCYFDIDVGIEDVLPETIEAAANRSTHSPHRRHITDLLSPHQACDHIDYFHHGGGMNGIPENHELSQFLCENIDVTDYLDITPTSNCITVSGKQQGTGPDNPFYWDDVLPKVYGGTCEDYDTCPANGISGAARGPANKIIDVKTCATDGSEATGLYPTNALSITPRLRGQPMRYTMPKFVCLSYPAGISSFTVTYKLGPGGGPPYYGRNFMFGGSAVVTGCEGEEGTTILGGIARMAASCDDDTSVCVSFQAAPAASRGGGESEGCQRTSSPL